MSKFILSEISRPMIMGILNVTPDSFSDGGRFTAIDAALRQTEAMLNAGAQIIDIGGESTRPGAAAVSETDELSRVIPVIDKIKDEFDCWVSLDTSKAMVMQAGIDAGVDMINDVCALSLENTLDVVASSDVPVCLMHMQGTPRTMQANPVYDELIPDICNFFANKIAECEAAGIGRDRICLDPGFGFGKTLAHNYQLLNELQTFNKFDVPVLAGLSRKSMIGNLLDLPSQDRVLGSVVAATIAMQHGAKIIRVHDVAESKQAVDIFNATKYGV